MFCCALLNVHSSFAIILMGKRELVALLSLSSWCLVIIVWLSLAVPLVVFPDHTHLLFLSLTRDFVSLSKTLYPLLSTGSTHEDPKKC